MFQKAKKATSPYVWLAKVYIVHDTGGLSIKDPPGMATMNTDMGGRCAMCASYFSVSTANKQILFSICSAAVLGSYIALVRSGVEKRIHALLCIAENSVGPLSTRPDDVHTLLSGNTVEAHLNVLLLHATTLSSATSSCTSTLCCFALLCFVVLPLISISYVNFSVLFFSLDKQH